jgi:hypothetical protein
VPRNWLGGAPPAGAPAQPVPGAPPVGLAPVPRLAARVGRGDPGATLVRVQSFAAVSARAAQPETAALAVHGLAGLVGADAVALSGRRPAAGQPTVLQFAQLPPGERTAITDALARGQAYPPRAEAALEAYLGGRVAGPIQRSPGSAGAEEEALAALLRLTA